MNWLGVTLTAMQPVSFGVGSTRAYRTESLLYVPGAVLRGALAARWLVNNEDECRDRFRQFFDGQIRFGPLFRPDSRLQSQSVRAYKYEVPNGKSRYQDMAFSDGSPIEACRLPDKVAMDPLTGRIVSETGDGIDLDIRTSTANKPGGRVAAESQLRSRAEHPVGTQFFGYIVGPDDPMENLPKYDRVFVGGKRGTGAQCMVEYDETPTKVPGCDSPSPNSCYVLRTLSPTVLVDAAGRPCTDLGEAIPANLEVIQVWGTRTTSQGVSGWHAASRLPKPEDRALAAGTTVVVKGNLADVKELVNHGIGVRRTEGFGFIERVTQPWDETLVVATETEQETLPEALVPEWLQEFDAQQRRWVAKQLRRVRTEAAIETVFAQPRARVFTEDQKKCVRKLLMRCESGNRNLIASELIRSTYYA